MCEVFWEPEAINLCINALKKISYKGLAEAEIQRDRNDGQLKFVEINARTTTEAKLSAKLGCNMEYIAYQDMLGMPFRTGPKKIKNLKWYDVLTDVISVFSSEGYLAAGKITLREWLDSLKGNRCYADFSREDPVPFLVSTLVFARDNVMKNSVVKKLLKRFAAFL